MAVHKVSGRYLRDALQRALEVYGGDAVVLSQRTVGDGDVALAVADQRPRTPEALVRMRGEANRVLSRVPEVAPRPPRTDDVERCLRRTGASAELIERVRDAVEARLDEGVHPLDLAGEEIGALFPIQRAPRVPGAVSVLALIGPAGAGKSTCALELVSRWARAGEPVGLASFDARRPGAAQGLKALGRELGIRTALVRDGARLAQALARAGAPRTVVLEGTGDPVADHRQIDRLEAAAAEQGLALHVQRVLVLAATHGDEVIERALSAGDADACALTMLDQTARPAHVLEHVLRAELGTAFLADGPDPSRLHRPRPDLFADLLLRGRIS